MELFTRYLKHPKYFLKALFGQPIPTEIPEHQVTYQETKNEGQGTENTPTTNTAIAEAPVKPIDPDDPLHQDLEKASSVFKKITSRFQKVSQPLVDQSQALSTRAVSSSQAFAKTDMQSMAFQAKFKKIIPILIFGGIILVLIIIGIFVVAPLISRMKTPVETPIVVTTVTPTPIEFTPTIPSVYSTDEETLKLEEDILLLDREIVGAQLRETTLNPPVLDFSVTF